MTGPVWAARPLPLAPGLSEAVWQSRIVELALHLRLQVHHETDSRKTRKGWPDLAIAGPGGFVVAELKTDNDARSKPTPEQQAWLDALTAADVRAYLWRPRHWDYVYALLLHLAHPNRHRDPATDPAFPQEQRP
ncbi:VRR-NUC domain-containing protein [Nocardioides sp. Leaf374]|uniref:VRR-NUC domain-containing protein n=1 Tax=Nocardioides sp. Leaf374 TaxID=2876560 RepID=UPI001E5840F0|nr:VRR-NUC domain-containing protein [Nocardioides sp. Leaf374]